MNLCRNSKALPEACTLRAFLFYTIMEIWKDVEGYEGFYQISNFGRFKSFHGINERIIRKRITKNGYEYVGLSIDKEFKKQTIHRLVACAFIDNPKNLPCVNHKNGIKTDNRADNLEWCTYSENNSHAFKNKLKTSLKGEKSHFSKITEKDAFEIKYGNIGLLQKEIAIKYNIKENTVSLIKSGKSWKHI